MQRREIQLTRPALLYDALQTDTSFEIRITYSEYFLYKWSTVCKTCIIILLGRPRQLYLPSIPYSLVQQQILIVEKIESFFFEDTDYKNRTRKDELNYLKNRLHIFFVKHNWKSRTKFGICFLYIFFSLITNIFLNRRLYS